MKFTIRVIWFFVFFFSLLGCNSTQETLMISQPTIGNTNEPTPTETPFTDSSKYSGKVFLSHILNSSEKQIMILDLSNNTIEKIILDRRCSFDPKTFKALCFRKCELLPGDDFETCESVELIEAQTKQSIFKNNKEIIPFDVDISFTGGFFTVLRRGSENILTIERNSLVNGDKTFEDEIRGIDWGFFPTFSENGRFLIGPGSDGGKRKLFLYDFHSKKAQEIFEFNNESFIPGIRWAENSNEFITQTTPWSGDVTAPCTNILYFNIESNSSKRIIDRELNNPCFLIDSAVISPDGKKIAVEMDDGLEYYGICIYSTQNDQQQCIKNVDKGNRISSPIWNPASDSIAFVDSNNQICIYSTQNDQQQCIKNLNQRNKISHPIWNPTSDYIAYIDSNNQVFIYGLEEKELELITTINGTDSVNPFAWIQ